MSKLITIKNKVTGNITRQPIGSIELGQFRGRHLGRFCFVQKKAFKRQEKDKSKIRSRKQPRPFGAKLHERLAKKYGAKMGFAKKKSKIIKKTWLQMFKEFVQRIFLTLKI